MSSTKRIEGRAVSLLELLVTITIVAVLTAILLPVFAAARENGRRVACLSNLRQIGAALTEYTQDNGGYFPPADAGVTPWAVCLLPYAPATGVFRCPECNVPEAYDEPFQGLTFNPARGYAINFALYEQYGVGQIPQIDHPALKESAVHFPSTTVSICESAYFMGGPGSPYGNAGSQPNALAGPDNGSELPTHTHYVGNPGGMRHHGGSDYTFVDGHVHWYMPSQISAATQTNALPHLAFVPDPTKKNDGADPSFEL